MFASAARLLPCSLLRRTFYLEPKIEETLLPIRA